MDHSVDLSIPDVRKVLKKKIFLNKGMDRSNKKKLKILYKRITANISAIWQHAAHTTDQFTSPSCYIGVIQKSLSLNEKY